MADDLVTIATFRYLTEAEAAKMHLQAEGLTVFLADAELVNMDWLFASAIGDIKLQVPKSEAEIARVFLAKMRRPRRSREDDEAKCLACGAEMADYENECAACGWSYAGKTDD